MGSLGVGAIEIGRTIVPDHRRHRQEVPKHILTMSATFLCFFCRIYVAWGGWGLHLFISGAALRLGGLKGQNTRGWFVTTHVFWHFLCLRCEWGYVAV